MTIINGHDLRLYIDGTAIAKATECSVSLNAAMREIAHKDTAGANGGFKEVSPGQKSGTATCNALYAEGESYETLFNAWSNGTKLVMKFSDDVASNKSTTADAYITSLEKNATDNENVTYLEFIFHQNMD